MLSKSESSAFTSVKSNSVTSYKTDLSKISLNYKIEIFDLIYGLNSYLIS